VYDPMDLLLPRLPGYAERMLAERQQQPGYSAPAQPPPLEEEEAQGLLKRAAGAGLGALHFVGSTVGKTFGGRAIRGVLGGKPHELLSVIPGSDLAGITRESDAVSGEDLARQWGLLQGQGEKGKFELRDLVGPAVELGLDPATYLSLGTSNALTASGKAAQQAGVLPARASGRIASMAKPAVSRIGGPLADMAPIEKAATAAAVPRMGESGYEAAARTVDELAGKPMAGLGGFGLPFSGPSEGLIFGTGPAGQKVAQWLEGKADKLAYGSVGRAVSRLFDTTVRNTSSEPAQRAMRKASGTFEAGDAAAHGTFLELAKALEPHGLLDPSKAAELRDVLEGVARGAVNPAHQAIADRYADVLKAARNEAIDVGRPVADLHDDFIKYATRQVTPPAAAKGGVGKSASFPTSSPNQLGREDILKNWPGGTRKINEAVADPHLRGLLDAGDNAAAEAYIAGKYHGLSSQDLSWYQGNKAGFDNGTAARTLPGGGRTPEYERYLTVKDIVDNSAGRRAFLQGLDPEYHKAGGIFLNHPLTDLAAYMLKHNRAQNGAEAVHDMFASAAHVGPGATGEMIPAADALKMAGLSFDPSNAQHLLNMGAVQSSSRGGPQRLLDELIKQGKVPAGATALGPKGPLEGLKDVMIPRAVAEDAARVNTLLSPHESLSPVLNAWDSITNLTKGGQTSPWPAFHTRNVLTGLWQNAVIGARDSRYHPLDPMGYIRPYLDAMALRNNGVIEGAADIYKGTNPGITDAQATRLLAEEMFQHQARVGLNATAAADAVGKGTLERPGKITLPGTGGEKTVAQTLNPKTAIDEARAILDRQGKSHWNLANPLELRGQGFNLPGTGQPLLGPLRDETTNGLFRYGQDLGHLGDDLNRTSAFLALRRQGLDAAGASARSKAATTTTRS
jgi:hypothetical protein